jgi:hypothetical protein
MARGKRGGAKPLRRITISMRDDVAEEREFLAEYDKRGARKNIWARQRLLHGPAQELETNGKGARS